MSRLLATIAVGLACLAPGTVLAQQPAHPVVHGVVIDSANNPINSAEVSAYDSTNTVVATGRTDKNGAFTLSTLAPNTPYIFFARQVGFAAGSSKPITLRAIDTLTLRFTLDRLVATLPTVSVDTRVNPAYRIDAAEIAKHPMVDALDVVLNLRPRMLGDAYKNCLPDTSHLTFGPTRGSFLLPKLSSPGAALGQTPPLLYINGVWHGELGMKNILSQIRVEDIAEMRYIDCWDTSVPIPLRNALFITLRPGAEY